jgi:hypothetical protein
VAAPSSTTFCLIQGCSIPSLLVSPLNLLLPLEATLALKVPLAKKERENGTDLINFKKLSSYFRIKSLLIFGLNRYFVS